MKDFNKDIAELIYGKFNKVPVYDGIVNIEEYQQSNPKILWILKDPNSPDEPDEWDMRGAISKMKTENGIKNKWEKTFKMIVCVTNGLLNNKVEVLPNPKKNPELILDLKKIAYINVKKTGGFSRSKIPELRNYYLKSKELLFEQIEEINPDILIFGGTFYLFKNDLNIGNMKKFGTCDATKNKNQIFVDAYHPQNTTVTHENYFHDIINAVKELKK